jgi:hypothetical protein
VLKVFDSPGVRRKFVSVSTDTFNLEHVVRLARNELLKKPRPGFIQLAIYADRGGAPLPQPDHVSYESWQRTHDLALRTPNAMAEIISVGRNTVLRMRDKSGAIRRKVIAGADPLIVELGQEHLEIVYFSFSDARPFVSQRVNIFVQTAQPLNSNVGAALLRKLEPVFPSQEVSVAIRNDTWFIYEPGYPFLNPFVKKQDPPTEEAYEKTRSLICGNWTGSLSCRLQ